MAWEKGDSVWGVLERISDIAKLKAGETGVPTEDLKDPRVALMKLKVEQDAPDFVREAEIPLRDKHFLAYGAPAGRLSAGDLLAIKREVVEHLIGEHRRWAEEHAAYKDWMSKADLGDLTRALGSGIRPRYPKRAVTAKGVWDHHVSRWWDRKHAEENAAHLEDADKLIEGVARRLKEVAPKTFGKEVDGEPAYELLERRLRAMPQPELVLLAAVLLRTPLNAWLDAVREEAGRDGTRNSVT